MPPATPQAMSRSANNAGTAAGLGQAPASSIEASRPKLKSAPMGDKVVIRRLPPAMTQDEFQSILGPVWHPGNGKVGWFTFETGKISKDPSKPPKPSRAYIQVLRKEDLFALSETVRTAIWEDAAGSFNHPGYMGPPAAEFSIYKKIPNPGKRKADARQGTIDQDPEFMDFLEKLANPPTKAEENAGEKPEDPNKTATIEITTTPLIEAIREKKAAKAREAANAKSAKQSQAAAAKEKKKSKDKDKDKKTDKPKETVKILTKKAAQEAAAGAAKNAASKIAATQSNASGGQAPSESDVGGASASQTTQKSRRAGIAAAARILQRDLGISPGSAHRRARLDAQKAEAEAKAVAKESTPASPKPEPASAKKPLSRPATPTAPKAQQQASQQQGKRGKGKQQTGGDSGKGKNTAASTAEATSTPPVPITILKKEKKTENQIPATQPAALAKSTGPAALVATASTSAAAPPLSAPTGPKAAAKKNTPSKGAQKKAAAVQVTAGATRAFVKHANPSQGVNEQLLKASLETFGTVVFVEIDRRKGFAYVDFADHEGLVKAMTASPIQVAQGTVQVLERRDKPNTQKAGGQSAAGEKGGKSNNKSEKDADSKGKVKENQLLDGGSASVADKGTPNSGPGEKADGAGAGGGSGGGGGKPKVRRGGRGRGARGKDGGSGGGSNAQQSNQQPVNPTS